MILADTSVWIDHFRNGNDRLHVLLDQHSILVHPFVIGELALGNLHRRETLLRLLRNLPQGDIASHDEVLYFIESNRLMGRGIGFIDAHLLASVALSGAARIWTFDRRLQAVARGFGLAT